MQNYRTNRTPIESPDVKSPNTVRGKDTHGLRKTFTEALDQVARDQSISFSPIDTWFYLLAIPSTFRYTQEETKQIAKEIQHTILPPKKPRSLFQILTWTQVANSQHQASPSYKDWYNGNARPFEDGSQYVFFIDTDIVKQQILKALRPHNFAITQNDDASVISVSDGHLEMSVPTLDIIEKSIWSAKDLSTTVEEWVLCLQPDFKLLQVTLKAFKTHFKDARFRVENHQLHFESPSANGELNYQKILKSIQHSKLTPLAWLTPLSLVDLLAFETHIVIQARSESFRRVRPQSLASAQEGYVLVAEKELSDRLVPFQNEGDNDTERFQRFALEDSRQLSRRHFSGHSFCHDDSHSFTMGIVGDQVASLIIHPELVLAALTTSFSPVKRVRVVAASEDIVVIAHENAPWSGIEEVIRRAHALLLKLSPDGSDPLFFDQMMDLPAHGCGNFAFTPIPAPYFDLMETAADTSLALPPGRCHYLRGLAFELIREWHLAEQEFRRAFASDSSDGDISHALGRALNESSRHKEALPFLKRAINLVPNDPEIANTYGLALLKCNHADLAARSFERAVELAPDDPQFLSNLGQSYFMSQRIKDAERILGKALEYAPNFSDAHSTLSQIKWRQGDLLGARKHARKAFAANPSNKGVQDLLWALTVDEQK
jgi:Tfp pilus assembly protein PilF